MALICMLVPWQQHCTASCCCLGRAAEPDPSLPCTAPPPPGKVTFCAAPTGWVEPADGDAKKKKKKGKGGEDSGAAQQQQQQPKPDAEIDPEKAAKKVGFGGGYGGRGGLFSKGKMRD